MTPEHLRITAEKADEWVRLIANEIQEDNPDMFHDVVTGRCRYATGRGMVDEWRVLQATGSVERDVVRLVLVSDQEEAALRLHGLIAPYGEVHNVYAFTEKARRWITSLLMEVGRL